MVRNTGAGYRIQFIKTRRVGVSPMLLKNPCYINVSGTSCLNRVSKRLHVAGAQPSLYYPFREKNARLEKYLFLNKEVVFSVFICYFITMYEIWSFIILGILVLIAAGIAWVVLNTLVSYLIDDVLAGALKKLRRRREAQDDFYVY